MTTVNAVTFEFALVVETPAWWRRWFLGEHIEPRFAERNKFGWHYSATGRPITDPKLLDKLDAARRSAITIHAK